MKKNGFTLAEVLITLAIIGVVATMTLPALIANTGEQQAKTAFKKAINTLTEAGTMNMAIDNWAYADVVAGKGDSEAQTLYALLANRASVDFSKGDALAPTPAPILPGVDTYLYLRDGSAIYFDSTTVGQDTAAPDGDDNIPVGYDIIYDTNGTKGPNILSNCTTTPAGAVEAFDSEADACTKATRIIKDQFLVRLRGSIAQPSGSAAKWAFNN